ncbi:MAG: polymer-forming cytoskeletal protein [Deltaproteobacteria bacterium]|nr:polymer-forming cytoskeletal protein [Deltaproteobacteria bacterium]MBW2071077.1 polymer-forming cytoskeletal protein [Deltaproteobacteria bacterium]
MAIWKKKTEKSANRKGLTFIGDNCKIEGRVEVQGELVVNGRLQGTVKCDTLHTGPSSHLEANIVAGNMFLSGRVEGETLVHQHLAITSTGVLSGKVSYETLSIESGGILNGDVLKKQMNSNKVLSLEEAGEPKSENQPSKKPSGKSSTG